MRERDIEKALVDRVRKAGGEVRKVAWPGRVGAPDRVVMLPGVLVWVELKRPGKKPTLHQLREHERMRRMGQCVLVIDSITAIEEVLT
jgi:Holliday junction resolvase